ncbi:MAG: hypothetical protein CSB16_02135 [Clostridiales bacterium]|nr:MAG: hypothetical protein CSB16_02135 [Clostridiales bacterium]
MIKKSEIYNLIESIDIPTGQVISQSIINDENIDVTQYGFYRNEIISYERSGFDKIYIPIKGTLKIKIKDDSGEKLHTISPFDFMFVNEGILREIESDDDYVIVMITIKRRETMLKNIEKGKLFKLNEAISYQEDKIATKTLASDEKLVMTLLAFDGKQELSTHSAPGDALVIALEGEARIDLDGTEHILKHGDSLIMPANLPHAVYVEKNYKMLLIVSK